MTPGLGSLRSRIFLASTLLAAASIGSAVYFVSTLLTQQAEAELRRDLTEAAELVDQQSETLFDGVTRTAVLIADLPKFKAALETGDPPTIEPIARDYLQQVGADLVVVSDRHGTRLAVVSAPAHRDDLAGAALDVGASPVQAPAEAFWPYASGVLQVVTVPVTIDLERPELLGTLSMGYLLDSNRAGELKGLTGADVAFAFAGTVRASSLPLDLLPAVTAWFNQEPHADVVPVGSEQYSALARLFFKIVSSHSYKKTFKMSGLIMLKKL